MEIDDYQKKAMTTCMPSSDNFAYMFLNFLGEVGELTEKIANEINDNELHLESQNLLRYSKLAKEIRKENESEKATYYRTAMSSIKDMRADKFLDVIKELGDIEWQWVGIHTELGIKPEDTLWSNLLKLTDRYKRNVIDGDGDNR